jgi:TRAP-type C4-dicarboxylate transport system permease small subunit
MEKLSALCNRMALILASTCFLVMTFLVFLQIVSRVADYSISWTEELSRFLFIWATLLGISIGVKQRFLISFSMIKETLPKLIQRYLNVLIDILILGFAIILIIYGIELVGKVSQQLSSAMRVSMSYVYLVVPISGTFILIHLLNNWYTQLLQKR